MDLPGAVVLVLLTLAVVSPASPLVLVVSVCIIIYNCKDTSSLMHQLLMHVMVYTAWLGVHYSVCIINLPLVLEVLVTNCCS